MTRLIFIIALSITLFSCNNQKEKQQEREIKAKELQLKEKEIPAENPDTQIPPIVTKNTEQSKNRKLRFLYYSKQGLRAYYNDGSVIDCPRCELTQENVLSIQNNTEEKGVLTYVIEKDGNLLVDGWKHEYPVVNMNENFEGWAMINYKWFVKY
ncbi:hypothetical protein QO200_06310 [Flavobacterium sp. Arc3]|uniref:hypothetical protein n=1 Tax=unclassified Flavobacterium TaxID=196869 RepID=UPI00352E2F1F